MSTTELSERGIEQQNMVFHKTLFISLLSEFFITDFGASKSYR
jgi:hypothetical protein